MLCSFNAFSSFSLCVLVSSSIGSDTQRMSMSRVSAADVGFILSSSALMQVCNISSEIVSIGALTPLET